MNNVTHTPDASGASYHMTTKRREWFGWFGSAVWMFFMMYGHDMYLSPEAWLSDSEAGTIYPFFFMAVFALAIIVFGLRYGNDPDGLSRVAFYTTPVAIVITAIFALLPSPMGSILYAVSPVFMAPALTRRIFGVVRTAGEGRQLTRFMSCVAVCVVVFTIWLLIELPREIAFLVPALLAIPVWLGIRRSVSLPEKLTDTGAFRFSKGSIFMLAAALILLFCLDSMNTLIHTFIITVGNENTETLLTLLGFLIPPVAFFLYGLISDKGHERTGLICGMAFIVIGVLIALLPAGAQGPWLVPLAFSDGLGGPYTEFFFLTIPIYFLFRSKRPVFTASFGLAAWLVTAALDWIVDLWMPEVFLTLGAPVLAVTAISAIGFVVLALFLFDRHREKTLAAALYAVLYRGAGEGTPADPAEAKDELSEAGTSVKALLPEEQEIAVLLIEGLTKGDIARRLHLSSAEVASYLKSIRVKVAGEYDPAVAAINEKYNLTRRETDMLRCLCRGMTNSAIAGELYLSGETVRIHVRNLMKKLHVENRRDVAALAETFSKEIE